MYASRRLIVLTVLLLTAACSSGGPRSGARSSPTVITNEEVRATAVSNAYDLVQALRPRWLRVRGATSLTETGQVLVYINEIPSGGVEVLRQIRPEAIESLRFLDEVSATARYGVGHGNGVIQVVLIAGR